MNHNETYFRQKFAECGKFLHTEPSRLVSLKYRRASDRSFYDDLLIRLRSITGMHVTDLGNTLNGRAYLLTYGGQNIVLVEHETGLEILYIAGSVASLIGLVLQINSVRRSHRPEFDHFPPDLDDVEVRYFDDADRFVQEHRHHYLPYEVFLMPQSSGPDIESLEARIARIETRLDILAKKPEKKSKKAKNTKK
jgi:hypothetical protein